MRTLRGFVFCSLITAASAAELKPQAAAAWDRYVQAADARMRERLEPGHSFLWLDEDADRRRAARAGEIVVAPMAPQMPERVPSGLIHHWVGGTFIPGATLEDVSAVARDYARYQQHYGPHVMGAKLIRQNGSDDVFSLMMMNTAFLKTTALEGDYESSYFQVDARRRYSILRSTRLQEIENCNQPTEHKLPVGQGTGYIWGLHAITRFEQRDGGVYVEVEAIALSRDIPASLHWLADPVVRRAAKNSLVVSLTQTRAAVAASEASVVSQAPAAGHASGFAARH